MDPRDYRDDDDLWLEELQGTRALEWAAARRAEVAQGLAADPAFHAEVAQAAELLESAGRIPEVDLEGRWVRNLWRDAGHPRGLWRRVPLDAYLTQADPPWETLLDLDRLAAEEGENWTPQALRPAGPESDRALVWLSRGGRDARVIREYDLRARCFVEGGFHLPQAKSLASWVDEDTLAIATDFGPGTLTDSGYPRQLRLWSRGTPLASARLVVEAGPAEILVAPLPAPGLSGFPILALRRETFFSFTYRAIRADGSSVPLPVPRGADPIGTVRDRACFLLREAWSAADIQAGSVIAIHLDPATGSAMLEIVFEPPPGEWVLYGGCDRNVLYLSVLCDVQGAIRRCRPPDAPGGEWRVDALGPPTPEQVGIESANAWGEGAILVQTGFLVPKRQIHVDAAGVTRPVRAESPRFDAAGLSVRQEYAKSADGTRVPYFLIAPVDAPAAGPLPLILTGYGGFGNARLPEYDPVRGRLWLERGGAWVVANLRGGGEFGPAWHAAAMREKRLRAYEDFEAVARDLIHRGFTASDRLGIYGGSNGGLLVGAAMTRHPELYRAVACRNPLLDMLRYARLSAGASWVEEYGDPDDPVARAWLRGYSPYHNLRPGVRYPAILFVTSTLDDRVHPGHARRMAERMRRMGARVLYHEAEEGGHAAAANLRQTAWVSTLVYRFFRHELGAIG